MDMWERGRRTIKESLIHKSGTTLVELIVTFALIGLFMAAATAMLTSSLQMFSRMQDTSSAITVSDLILDKIAGEIVAADIPKKEEGNNNGYYFWLEPEITTNNEESHWVVFRNRSKSPIAIFAAPTTKEGKARTSEMGKGQLFIRYYAVTEEGGLVDQRENQKAIKEIDWHFDNKVYMNYTIENLYFSRDNVQEHPNVVKINLTLKNERTGFIYSSYRYAENYNYDFGSGYMCARDEIEPGNVEFPLKAEEFKIKAPEGDDGGDEEIKPKPEPEKTVGYTLYFLNEKGEELRTPESGKGGVGTQIQIVHTRGDNGKVIQIVAPFIRYYKYVPSKSSSEIQLGELEDKNKLYLYYKPSEEELVNFTVIYRETDSKQELKKAEEKSYQIESVITIPLKDFIGYQAISEALVLHITKEVEGKIFYIEYKKNDADDYFQNIIPLDKNGWIEITEYNKDKKHVILPGGIFKWNDGKYYIVIEKIEDEGFNLYNPYGTYFTNNVIGVEDMPVLNYDETKKIASSDTGHMYYGRVFEFKGNYYVYNSRELLQSPEEKATYWHKIP